jgi:hypothetical protein
MTKQHFETMAKEFRDLLTDVDVDNDHGWWYHKGIQDAAKAMADVAAEFNPRFDRARFLLFAGVESE